MNSNQPLASYDGSHELMLSIATKKQSHVRFWDAIEIHAQYLNSTLVVVLYL
jgi:hypothetical protein